MRVYHNAAKASAEKKCGEYLTDVVMVKIGRLLEGPENVIIVMNKIIGIVVNT